MKKTILIVASFLFVFNLISFSQSDSGYYLKGYDPKNYLNYFDSLHNIKKGAIENLNHSYSCYIVFKVDKNASISNFEFIEIPDAPLTENVKDYIKHLFYTTNGRWGHKKTSLDKINSDDLLFSLTLVKASQSIHERLKDLDKSFEFALMSLSKQKRLEGYNLIMERNITLSF